MKDNKTIKILVAMMMAICVIIIVVVVFLANGKEKSYLEIIEPYDISGIITQINLLKVSLDSGVNESEANYIQSAQERIHQMKALNDQLSLFLEEITVPHAYANLHGYLSQYQGLNHQLITGLEALMGYYTEIGTIDPKENQEIAEIYQKTVDQMNHIVDLSTQVKEMETKWTEGIGSLQ